MWVLVLLLMLLLVLLSVCGVYAANHQYHPTNIV
jgi:hypothetical protein